MSLKLIDTIHAELKEKQMLNHPFYRDWMEGKLSLEQLQNYAAQYMPFVDAFPQFVSATHSRCDSPAARKTLLENLLDEEGFRNSEPHPELWRDFAVGVGANLEKKAAVMEKAAALKEVFFELSRSSYEEGLCALYAYEYQIPEISKAKIQGLAEHYGITDAKTQKFFAVHQEADVYHSRACAELIDGIEEGKKDISLAAAKKASVALWDFLSEVH